MCALQNEIDAPEHRTLLLSERACWLTEAAQKELIDTGVNFKLYSVAPELKQLSCDRIGSLGSECDLLIFDTQPQFNVDTFCALVGTLKGGCPLVLLVDYDKPPSVLLKRLIDYWRRTHAIEYCGTDILRQPRKEPFAQYMKHIGQAATSTIGNFLSEFISHDVVNRVLITGQRGRGKSHGTGKALAQIAQNQTMSIVVTYSRQSQCEILREALISNIEKDNLSNLNSRHVQLHNGSFIRFIAADKLIIKPLSADLLVIEEAASLPVYQIETISQGFRKIIFVSTTHGYEGYGRGFYNKYWKPIKTANGELSLDTPIRWRANDHLEQAVNHAFLLIRANNEDKSLPESVSLQGFDKNAIAVEKIESEGLDEDELQQVMNLLCEAHYQTRPSDIERILDENNHLWIASYHQQILAVGFGLPEGGLCEATIAAMFHHNQQCRGELTPQAMIFHLHRPELAQVDYLRISRIAVNPLLQRQGVGSMLIEQMKNWCSANHKILVTSFSASQRLVTFWQKNGFLPIFMGHKIKGSGDSVNLLMVYPGDTESFNCLANDFQSLFDLRCSLLSHPIPSALRKQIKMPVKPPPLDRQNALNDTEIKALNAFCQGQRHWFSCVGLIRRLFMLNRRWFKAHHPEDHRFMAALLSETYSFKQLLDKFELNGKRCFETRLKLITKTLLSATDNLLKNE